MSNIEQTEMPWLAGRGMGQKNEVKINNADVGEVTPDAVNKQVSNASRQLPHLLRTEVTQSPKRGSGVHNWLFVTALKLHKHLRHDQIFAILSHGVRNCGRNVPVSEIKSAIANSARIAGKAASPSSATVGGVQPASTVAPARWPDPDPVLVQEVINEGGSLSQLGGGKFTTYPSDAESVIDHLFPGNALLCCGLKNWKFDTKTRDEWRGQLNHQQFIVPSPMSAKLGIIKDGSNLSAHTLDNTGPRRFMVVEFDQGASGQQFALHLHLSRMAPLAMVVFSGSKSLHGWYFCAGANKGTVRSFFSYAVRLGADPVTWTRSQFVRMPWGTRHQSDGSSTRQSVYHLNPEALK